MNLITKLPRWWLKSTHHCIDHWKERRIAYINRSPGAIDSPLSIYGPVGSCHLWLYHCPVCDTYGGKRYDMYGGIEVSPEYARNMWAKPVDNVISEFTEWFEI